MEPLRHIKNADFGAVIFRRESPQIFNEGGLWDESEKLYPLLGGKPTLQPAQWVFPTGARVTMTHLQHEKNKYDWQGSQVPLIEFDELTHFTRSQFFYLLSRNRSLSGVQPYMRATCNPDPDSWVVEVIGWWIGEDGFPIKERGGVIRWFVNINDTLRWADTREELLEQYGEDCEPKSLTFIPSSIYDNKILLEKDPSYLANLKAQSQEEQMRLLHGNWKYRREGGLVKRAWILRGSAPVELLRVVVAVDPSVTANKTSAECGIVVVAIDRQKRGYVLDDLSGVLTPEQWGRRVVNAYIHYGADLVVGEVNNGGDLVETLIRSMDPSINYKAVRASRGKIVRLEPVAGLYERSLITHTRIFDPLENQLTSFDPKTSENSPDRLDALVWGFTELMLSGNVGGIAKVVGV